MIVALLFAAALSAGSQEFERDAVQGAERIATAEVVAEMQARPLAAGFLEKSMLEDSSRHVRRADSEALCRETYRKAIADEYRRRVYSIARRLGVKPKDGEMPANALEEAVARNFASVFDAERRAACAKQSERFVASVKPSAAEFEATDEAELVKALTRRIAESQRQPVFEENHAVLSEKIVLPMVENARAERARQREYVRDAPSDALAPTAIAKDLSFKLAADVRERGRAGKDEFAWGVFPSVTNETMKALAEDRLTELYARRIGEVPVEVKTEDVMRMFSSDPVNHRKTADSKRIFRTAEGAAVLAAAAKSLVERARTPERAELETFLGACATEGGVVTAVDRRTDAMIAIWQEARKQSVDEEYVRIWPTLADRTWFPDAQTTDDMAARSDYAAAIRRWRAIPGLSGLSREKDVLQETAKRADSSVSAAFDLARGALAEQLKIVDAVHPEVLAEARRRKDAFFTRTPDLQTIVELLTDATRKRWSGTRENVLWPEGDLPPNSSEQHAELFPSVIRRIELVAKSILEEMQEEKDPEEPKQEVSEPEEEREKSITIVVERSGGGVRVKLSEGSRTVFDRQSCGRMDDFRGVMRALTDTLGKDLLRLAQ